MWKRGEEGKKLMRKEILLLFVVLVVIVIVSAGAVWLAYAPIQPESHVTHTVISNERVPQ